MKNGEQPAHPSSERRIGEVGETYYYQHFGLTKREYFAAMAMQGVISRYPHEPSNAAQYAVQYADALLSELEKTNP